MFYLQIDHRQFAVSLHVTERNATGHIVHIEGTSIYMLEALSQMLNFRWGKIYLGRRFPVTSLVPHEDVNVLLFVQLFFPASRRVLSRRFVVWKRRNFVPNKRRRRHLFMQILKSVFVPFLICKKEADYLLSTSVATSDRLQKVDYPTSWAFQPFSTLLPYPRETFDLAASFKPLSYEVKFSYTNQLLL